MCLRVRVNRQHGGCELGGQRYGGRQGCEQGEKGPSEGGEEKRIECLTTHPNNVCILLTSQRLFGRLEDEGINVVLIAQASSEHSITLAVAEHAASDAERVLREVFSRELKLQHITDITVHKPCSIIAAVGDGMSDTTGVAGRFFSALGESKINILAIAQGCSERNISCVVRGPEATRALRAVHAAFRLSHQSVRVGVVMSHESPLGCALLELLKKQREKIMMAFDIDVQVIAVSDEDRLLYTDNGGR